MLNTLARSLWKICVHIFLYHNIGIHVVILIIFMYSFSEVYLSIIGLIMIVIFRQSIRIVYIGIFITIFGVFLFFTVQSETHIYDRVKIVQTVEKKYQTEYEIRYKGKTYLFYDQKDTYNIGDVLFIDAKVEGFSRKTRPFGMDFHLYYLSMRTYGTLQIQSIKRVNESFHIHSLRQNLIDSFDRFESNEIFLSFIFDIEPEESQRMQWLYLMRMSGMHIFLIIELLRRLFKKHMYHPVYPFILSLVFLFLQDYNPSMMRLSLYYSLSLLLYMSRLILNRGLKLVITWAIHIFFMPYLIFHVGLSITYGIVISIHYIQEVFSHHPKIMRLFYISATIQILFILLANQFVFTQVMFSPLFFGFIFFMLYPFMLLTLIIPLLDPVLFNIYQYMLLAIDSLDSVFFSVHIKEFQNISLIMFISLYLLIILSKNSKIFVKRCVIILFFIGIHAFTFIDSDVKVYALDVGQGDSNIIYSRDCVIIIDAFQYVEETLLGLGVKTIDYVFITHDDIDHVKELKKLTEVFDIKHIISNPYTILDVDEQMSIEIPFKVTCGVIIIDILGPLKDYGNDNDNSLVIKAQIYQTSILFMGDASKEVELDLIDHYANHLQVNIIKIGHHGSSTSSHALFIKRISATHAIISVGRRNRYKMPHQDVMETLVSSDLQILRTDTMGTIEMHINKEGVSYRFYEP